MNIKDLANSLFNKIDTHKDNGKVVVQYHRGGKGRKQCPVCKSYVGVRTKVCKCSHVFEFSESSAKDIEEEKEASITDNDRKYALSIGANSGVFVYVGSGSPLGKVYGVSVEKPESVINFCEDIVSFGIKNNKIYLPSAIKNFLRHSMEDCEKVFNIVDDWYNQKLESVANVDLGELNDQTYGDC